MPLSFGHLTSSDGPCHDEITISYISPVYTCVFIYFLTASDEDTGDRRKRSVEDASVPQGSMELITSLLQVHHVMARGTPDADLDPVSAQLYIDDIQNYMVALCNGMVYGEDMATVISEVC